MIKRHKRKYTAFFAVALTLCAIGIIINAERVSIPTYSPMFNFNNITLVIDPGHGGMDGGAQSDSGVCEKNINLAISEKTSALCDLFGIENVMTRDSDISLCYDENKTVRQNKTADLKGRVAFAEKTSNPVFLSIHLNKFSQSVYKGAQTFYSAENSYSKPLAEHIQKSLITGVDPSNTRVSKEADSKIYVLKNLKCPAVIIECGFLSNPNECVKLQDDEYQKQLAYYIINGYLEFLEK